MVELPLAEVQISAAKDGLAEVLELSEESVRTGTGVGVSVPRQNFEEKIGEPDEVANAVHLLELIPPQKLNVTVDAFFDAGELVMDAASLNESLGRTALELGGEASVEQAKV